jgi:predicted lipoprotein
MIVLATSCFLSAPARAQVPASSFDHAGLARQALEQHIRPGYAKLATAAVTLSQVMDRFCTDETPAHRKRVEAAFDGFVTAWGHIEHIGFGPVTNDKRMERILFWPDRRGIGVRQVARVLNARDQTVLDPQTLATKSVALQGLGSLEFILFDSKGGKGGDTDGRVYRCRYAAAIAANLAAITQAIAEEWTRPDGFAHLWLAPGSDNPVFLKSSETTLALAKAFDHGIERVRDERVGSPLGLNKQRNKTPAVLQSSGRTLRLVRAQCDGLLDLFTNGGMRAAIAASKVGEHGVSVPDNAALVVNELGTARSIADELLATPKPFDGGPASRRLVAMGFPLKNAREQAAALLTLTAGLTMGFNASDGD